MRKTVKFLVEVILFLLAAGIIAATFLPIANWYFSATPLWGVDFYYTATIVNLIQANLTIPPLGWGYAWFSGWPIVSNYPILHYYIILAFTHFFDLISAIKIWMLTSLFIYFLGCYIVFYQLCKNWAVSTVLSIGGIYSVGVYGTLMWGGSLPSHATQAFFPWVLFLLICYLKNNQTKFLLLGALLTGISILAHPQIVIAYIYPSSFILFITWFGRIKLINRIKSYVFYFIVSFIVGLPGFYVVFLKALQSIVNIHANKIAASTVTVSQKAVNEIEAFSRAQPLRIFHDTNTAVFILLGAALAFFLLGLILRVSKQRLLDVLPVVFLAGWLTAYIWMFAYGISIYHGGWYRLFWTTPLWLGMVVAVFWGYFQHSLKDRLVVHWHFKGMIVIVSFLILGGGLYLVLYFSSGFKERVIARSTPSSAFPDVLNLRVDPDGREQLKTELVPNWLDPQRTDYRLYGSDQTVNIWWNSLYKMPLARGYFDPPSSSEYTFWLDAALSQDSSTGEDQLAGSFKYPKEIAFNNSLFLVDWYAVKFAEAGHASPTVYAPLPKSLTDKNLLVNEQELEFNKEKYNKLNLVLHYFEFKDELVSPILTATNAPVLCIFGSDQGFGTIIRGLADLNLSSQQVIPLKFGKYLDKISLSDLRLCDAVIIYDYDYQDKAKAFRQISDYVKKGGKVFIDTGGEVKQSEDKGPLPDFFPIDKTYRKPLGRTWEFEVADDPITRDVDFSTFDPPIFDGSEWNLSFPQQPDDVRQNAVILLKNHTKPILVSENIENGFVFWSGMNLPYHIIRNHNTNELVFFKKIIEKLIGSEKPTPPQSTVKFISAGKRELSTSGARGVLFKEQAYDGWNAVWTENGRNRDLKVYKAGPADPGFIFVRLPAGSGTGKLIFSYNGSGNTWLVTLLSVTLFILILDEVIFGEKLLGGARRWIWRKFHHRLTGWWGREDEI
ncbi:hypothetical protein HYW46_01125 [Candidatus Daviesbacteria bacterium]|nr:hypothetical protein [Candidatus Daviesbacteria bacterium]